jgi:hypothetical protein
MVNDTADMCAVCAWRATCQKKFSLSGRDRHCADFTRDVTFECRDEADEPEDDEGKPGRK